MAQQERLCYNCSNNIYLRKRRMKIGGERMNKMKKALALLLAVGLLAEPFFTGVGISGVQAAEKADTTAPIITGMKLKSSSPVKRTGQVELEVAYKEEGTGVNEISAVFYDEETFSMVQFDWKVGEEEKRKICWKW